MNDVDFMNVCETAWAHNIRATTVVFFPILLVSDNNSDYSEYY